MKRSFLSAAGLLLVVASSYGQLDIQSGDVKDASGLVMPTKILKDGAKGATPGQSKKAAKGPTVITSNALSFGQETNMIIFTDKVLVKDPQFDISCQKLTAYMKKDSGKNAEGSKSAEPAPIGADPLNPAKKAAQDKSESAIEKAIAETDVVIIQDKVDGDGKPKHYVAKAQKAIYETSTGDVTLYGWPQITESIGGSMSKQTTAQEESCIIILNSEGKINVKGYNTTKFQDMSGMTDKPKTQ